MRGSILSTLAGGKGGESMWKPDALLPYQK